MKILNLLRHAKSDLQDSSKRDFDRPLNDKGKRVSRAMGSWVAEQKITFDHIIASPAIRVSQTLEHFAEGYSKRLKINWERKVYLASSVTLLDMVRECDSHHDSILLVGHNPGIEDVIFDLVPDDGSSPYRDNVEKKYPTGTFAQLEIDINSWSDLNEPSAKLVTFIQPRDINPSFGPDKFKTF